MPTHAHDFILRMTESYPRAKDHVKIIETRPREIGFVLWGHCQNLLDDPRMPYSECMMFI